jgi:hypothetical protein
MGMTEVGVFFLCIFFPLDILFMLTTIEGWKRDESFIISTSL